MTDRVAAERLVKVEAERTLGQKVFMDSRKEWADRAEKA